MTLRTVDSFTANGREQTPVWNVDVSVVSALAQRQHQLEGWAHAQLPLLGLGPLTGGLVAVSGDASFRRYFRARSAAAPVILVDAPPERENSQPFLDVAARLAAAGVRVPRVLASDLDAGWLCLEDFGDALLWPALDAARQAGDLAAALQLYQRCFGELLLIQQAGNLEELPAYDAGLLRRELQLFPQWCCGGLLGLTLTAQEQALIEATFGHLTARALQQPRVLVHRDYHSRNLMLLAEPGRTIGVIDFQDAVAGPATYDLVSLLKDCYIAWPAATVRQWALAYAAEARRAGIPLAADDEEFLHDFALMGAQRHLKVLGIFCRLWLRDGKPGYLKDLLLTFRYTLEALAPYAEHAAFVDFLQRRIAPALPPAIAAAESIARQRGQLA